MDPEEFSGNYLSAVNPVSKGTHMHDNTYIVQSATCTENWSGTQVLIRLVWTHILSQALPIYKSST